MLGEGQPCSFLEKAGGGRRLTASSSPRHCRAFFFTEMAGSLQRCDSIARLSEVSGITPCFRRPTSA